MSPASSVVSPQGPALLQQAMQAHQAGQPEQARALYQRLLAVNPKHPDALHLLGLLHAQQRQYEEAGRLIALAIEQKPGEALFHNNMGNVWVELGRSEEALASYRRAHALDPLRLDVRNNLAVLLSRAGNDAEIAQAEALLRGIIDTEPAFKGAADNLANHYLRHGRLREAMEVCVQALIVAPRHPALRRVLGLVYASLGRLDDAVRLYRAWLDAEPDSAEARFRLQACTQEAVPDRAPDDFVAETFDTFAESFDAKLASLAYRAPELVAEAVAAHAGPPAGQCDVIDAGCGTGLCGPLLKPWARRLEGVDLSPGMLAKAELRGVYDALEAAELVAHLQARSASCDLLVSADTLCYFGVLDAFAAAAAGTLRPGGLLVFTVEAHEDGDGAPDYILQSHGRYSHRQRYLHAALGAAGLRPVEMRSVQLRMEAGRPVNGWLVSARRD